MRNDRPFYDFSKFDLFVDHLIELKLHPVLEFMGNPSEIFTRKLNVTTDFLWEDLVFQIVSRAISKLDLHFISNLSTNSIFRALWPRRSLQMEI